MQEDREGSGEVGMDQTISGRRDLERLQSGDVEMAKKTYNMMRIEDFSTNDSAQLCALRLR